MKPFWALWLLGTAALTATYLGMRLVDAAYAPLLQALH